jgi:hypothetical protein
MNPVFAGGCHAARLPDEPAFAGGCHAAGCPDESGFCRGLPCGGAPDEPGFCRGLPCGGPLIQLLQRSQPRGARSIRRSTRRKPEPRRGFYGSCARDSPKAAREARCWIPSGTARRAPALRRSDSTGRPNRHAKRVVGYQVARRAPVLQSSKLTGAGNPFATAPPVRAQGIGTQRSTRSVLLFPSGTACPGLAKFQANGGPVHQNPFSEAAGGSCARDWRPKEHAKRVVVSKWHGEPRPCKVPSQRGARTVTRSVLLDTKWHGEPPNPALQSSKPTGARYTRTYSAKLLPVRAQGIGGVRSSHGAEGRHVPERRGRSAEARSPAKPGRRSRMRPYNFAK